MPGLTPPKPLTLDYNLGNPWAQPKPTNTGIVSTSFYQKPPALGKPIKVGNVTVDTKNPVIVENSPVKGEGGQIKEESKKSFWEKQTKLQKGLIIGGAVAIVAFVGYLALSNKK